MSEEVRAENCSDCSHISKMTVELFTILWYNLNIKIVQQILLMFVKDFFLKVAQKKGRTKRTHQIAGFETMM